MTIDTNLATNDIETAFAEVLDLGIQERKAELAQQIGLDDVRGISTVSLDIARMRRMGVLVDVDIHGLSMLSARASWAELGIPPGDVRRERLRRGNKDLFPEHARQFRSLETRLRGSLDKRSFILEGFRPYRWIPFTAYEVWREEWDQLQQQWDELLADLLARYDDIVAEERAVAAEIANEAWDALVARHKAKNNGDADSTPVIVIGGQEFANEVPAEFVAHIQERALARIPTKAALAQGMYADYRTALVLSGADVEADALRSKRIRTEQDAERARQVEVQAQVETVQKQEWAVQRQLALGIEEEEQTMRMRLEAESKRLRAMHEAELEHARRQLNQIISPFDEVFQQLRSQIHQDVSAITVSIEKNGYLRGKVADRARSLVDTFRLLNAHGDEALESALDALKGRLAQHPEAQGQKAARYDTQAVLNQIGQIKALTHQAAADVAQRAARPTRARALEL